MSGTESLLQDGPRQRLSDYQTFEAATAPIRERLISRERRQKVEYQVFSIVFNLLSIAQVMIGATITALGPTGGEHILAITILGALNTSIAGLLALLKGRGLPQRLRRNMTELAKVLDYIEEQTMLLKYGSKRDSSNGIDALIEDALKRYTTAADIIERNQPDPYVGGNTSQIPTSDAEPEAALSHESYKMHRNGKGRATDEETGPNEAAQL